jgi:hypothetical protein
VSNVIKPWHRRLATNEVCKDYLVAAYFSADDLDCSFLSQMLMISCKLVSRCPYGAKMSLITLFRILRVPFMGSVKLRSLLLKAGPADQTPVKVALVRMPLLERSFATKLSITHLLTSLRMKRALILRMTRCLRKSLTLFRAQR